MSMQKQISSKLSLSQWKNKLFGNQNSLQGKFLKQLLSTMISKMQHFESRYQQILKSSQKNNNNDQLVQLVKSKVVQIEQRRKLWDLSMADIYNQKFQIKKIFKAKMQEADQLHLLAKTQIQSMKQQLSQKFLEIEKEKNEVRLMISQKIQKVEEQVDILVTKKIKQFDSQVQKYINKLSQNYKQIQRKNIQQYNNSFKFVITCEQAYNKIKQKQQIIEKVPITRKLQYSPQAELNNEQECKQKQPLMKSLSQNANQCHQYQKLQQSHPKSTQIDINDSNSEKNPEKIQNKYCNKMQIILHNINLLETLQKSINDSNSTIERFQSKLVVLGQKIQKIQNKISDVLQYGLKTSVLNNKPRNQQIMRESARVEARSSIINNQFINTRSSFINKFMIQGNKITYFHRQGLDQTCILLGKQSTRVKNSFGIKILKTKQKYISIGIVDAKYLNERDCWNKQNFIFLRGFKGQLYSGPIKKIRQTGCTFENDDQIHVIVNHRRGLIQWFINQELRASYMDQKISNEAVNWVPLIRLFTNLDQIEFLYQENQ